MKKSYQIREQLEDVLIELKRIGKPRPAKGWIRSMREGLGMSGRQLAERIEVEPSRIPEMEKAEVHGNITLKSLRRAAEAMDCDLIYALVPKSSMESAIRVQAQKAATKNFNSIIHTMRLEDQGLSAKENEKQLNRVVEELVKDPPRWLWDLK